MRGRSIHILLVEDNPLDVELTLESMKEAKVLCRMDVVGDGEEALAYLRKAGRYRDAPTPDLVLLDLNLPRKDGREVLAEVKEDPDLKVIPVVVMTSSEAEADVLKAYRLHANSYVVKPVTLERLIEVVKRIEGFWLDVVMLPNDAVR